MMNNPEERGEVGFPSEVIPRDEGLGCLEPQTDVIIHSLFKPLKIKKLEIKSLRALEMEGMDFDHSWTMIENELHTIMKSTKTSCSFENICRKASKLCKTNKSLVIQKLRHYIVEHVDLLKDEALMSIMSGSLPFVKSVKNIWETCEFQMSIVTSLFLSLDKTNNKHESSSVWRIFVETFEDSFLSCATIEQKIFTSLMDLITRDRLGENIERHTIKSVISMFCLTQHFHEKFEETLLKCTEAFYKQESVKLLESLNAEVYIQHVQKRLKKETENLSNLFTMNKPQEFMRVVEKFLIGEQMQLILTRGFDDFMERNARDNLELLFELLSRFEDGPSMLAQCFEAYVRRVGENVIQKNEKDSSLIRNIISFNNKMNEIIVSCFGSNENITRGLHNGFESVLNCRSDEISRLLVAFIHLNLTNRQETTARFTQTIDDSVALLNFIQGKETFMSLYRVHLAKRLIRPNNLSEDIENKIVAHLGNEHGREFTFVMEGMLHDIQTYKSSSLHFQNTVEQLDSSVLKGFNIKLLTSGKWPKLISFHMTIPQELKCCTDTFETYYKNRYETRHIKWLHSLGSCVLKGYFRENCVKELEVPTPQAVVLLLFNNQHVYTTKDIQRKTEIDRSNLDRTLFSLACGKTKFLLKIPKNRQIGDDDMFIVNDALQDPRYRLQNNQCSLAKMTKHHNSTVQLRNEFQDYENDAFILSVMQEYKTISHQQLVSETKTRLRSTNDNSVIEDRIKSLMERGYFSRDSNNSNIYFYNPQL